MEKIQIITEIVRNMDAKTTVVIKEEGILFKKHFYLDELLELCETYKERCDGKETPNEMSNCIKPAVMESDCDHEWLNHSFDHFGFLQEQICDKCGAKQSVL